MTTAGWGLVVRPGLFERLSAGTAGDVVLVSAPAGSGKTVLLRSWIEDAGLADRVAWVSVERGERDAQRFWRAVVEALRAPAGPAVDGWVPTPEFEAQAFVKGLLAALGALDRPVVLVLDDLHELAAPEALAHLALLLTHRPPQLAVVLATRHDPPVGLHRLRLAGQLTEVRAADLRFTPEQTRELLGASGIDLPEASVALLHARTEGWAAGLRLAALSLAGHPDPERFVAEFSGSERTVAEYLLAEVLERQPGEVRRLLLRTSILERVSGPLADALTGSSGSERVLLALEDANAFVVSLDASRKRFRYHHLFADLLRLELRRSDPDAVGGLHRAAAAWFADHGDVVAAVGHAQAAGDWAEAAHLIVDHGFSLYLDGQRATVSALIEAFPQEAATDPEVQLILASDELRRGSLDDAAAYLALAERQADGVPPARRRLLRMWLDVMGLSIARRRGDYGSAVEEVRTLLEPADPRTPVEVVLGNDARAVALMELGAVQLWSLRPEDAERHLAEGLELARRIRRPYVELVCLAHLALVEGRRSHAQERRRCAQALAVAEAQGWLRDAVACVPLATRGAVEVVQGRFQEAQQWLDRAEQVLRPHAEPATAVLVHVARGLLHAGCGRLERAVAVFTDADRVQAMLVKPNALTVLARAFLALTLVRLGRPEAARGTLAGLSDEQRALGEARVATAAVHLAGGDAAATAAILAPVVDGAAPALRAFSVVQALLLDAVARDLLGDPRAAEDCVERALDLAEPDGVILPFLLTPARHLLERHPRHRTAHAALLSDVLEVLAGSPAPRDGEPPEPVDDLSAGELRVLRHLPSNLSAPEIAAQLYLSTSTVKTHMRHIYAKLGVHRRSEAVDRARALGLLAPSARR